MKMKRYIPVIEICESYKIEHRFIDELNSAGLVEVIIVEKENCLHVDMIRSLEKMIRLHQELNVNTEGIDVIFNLLDKVDQLQDELLNAKNRLRLYE